jgi:predicted nucleotidyltransferase
MDLDTLLVEELGRVHAAHTIILYGSRARGDATPESDIDVAAFADVDEPTRDARLWNEMYLDGFVYPTAVIATFPSSSEPDLDMLKFLGARVLLDTRGLAAPFLEAVDALDRRGPKPIPEDDARMRRVWAKKMLARIRRGDVEAHYRFHWLLYQLLEDYFALRNVWYRGPKEALAGLRADEPKVFAAFERALAPGGSVAELEALIDLVGG